ncbi:FAD-dependent oxidoreductase [Clostridium folliculivorans]|uniref:Oxidoreductase n=1 Tax=Clostridium folliculivorans TaxID=2886038 RepID=A0A9W5Y575_9CLOT|nr:FAD-dependent oxidoreductase [Clostridium folliculivorans]GKU26891.1 oxidoreductase [Clostridium folliculivorans]GKU31542.1 oxidoreductase [Clostridium folliculivorans]
MRSLEVKDDIHWVGALDPDLRIFDIIMYTPNGTTYNSYVVKGSEKVAIFETVKVQFFDQYIARLKSLNVDINNIDYIVVDHTEPDHAGSVAKLLELSPNAKIVGSAPAIKFMRKIANTDFKAIVVNDKDTISLGNKTLTFISAPFLHWPDSIYTYIKEDKVLITCDSFGSHFCFEGVFDDLIPAEDHDRYMESLRYYYDCIMGPFKPFVLKAIEKIKDLDIDTICTGHGPVLRTTAWDIVNLYKEWSTPASPREDGKKKVTISYVSAYGYTEQLAHKIAEGITSTGAYEIKIYNVIHHDMKDIVADISDSDGILFGSPTIVSELLEPIRDVLSKLNPVIHGGKVAAAFGSYGWSGEAVPRIETRLEELKMNIYGPGLKINFKPSEEDLQKAFEFGVGFGETVLQKKKSEYIPNNKPTLEKIEDPTGELKLWKCVICGEIFESELPPEICPVCGAGSDQFVEVERENAASVEENNDKYIIIGNGAAGFYAAKAIRENNKKGEITIVSKEEVRSYFRPQLSDLITKDIPENKFYIAPEKWYEENSIRQLLGVTVTDIISDDKVIKLDNGESLNYDKLILANGSYNFIPPTAVISPNGDKLDELNSFNYSKINGVYTIKDVNDTYEVKNALKDSKNAIVIGGGLLGLEAAYEISMKGTNVTVVEFLPRLLPRQLDEDGSKLFKDIIDKSEVNVILGECCKEVIVENNTVTAIKLASGKILNCDLLLFSVGVRPHCNLAKLAGVNINRGILVNDNMETNVPSVYACGDVAELNGIVYGTWPAAIEMGKVAGTNAVSSCKSFNKFVSSVMFNALGAHVFSAGSVDFADDSLEEVANNVPKDQYSKLFFKDDKLVAGILIGGLGKATKILSGIGKGISKSDALSSGLIS